MVRDLSAGFGPPDRPHEVFEHKASIAVLSTPLEDTRAWLRAGLALQRLLLVATSYDLTVSFLNQALEYADLRDDVRNLIGRPSWPQLVLRCGYPAYSADRTPRRPLSETLDHHGVDEIG